jgi:hypothetical protein
MKRATSGMPEQDFQAPPGIAFETRQIQHGDEGTVVEMQIPTPSAE